MGSQIEDGRARTTISVSDLLAHGICADQLALFRATFGASVEVTEANMSRAVDVGLHIEWLKRLLAAPAWLAFEVACGRQAWATYVAACYQASEPYQAAYAQALAAYRRALVGPLVRALRAEDGARASLSPSSPNHADMVVPV